jgi:hypothetical protein
MRAYISEFAKSIFQHGAGWWGSLLATYILQIGVWAEYGAVHARINAWIGSAVMPASVPVWALIIPFLVWVIIAFAHDAAMREIISGHVVFSKPHRAFSPLYARQLGGKSIILHEFYGVKVDVSNQPHSLGEGKDVVEAWAEVELFDGNSKPVISWLYPRWEDNKQPGYADHPLDHYPDDQKVRTLSANGRPNTLCLALKPIKDEYAYSFRGEDQLQPEWKAQDKKIPAGTYLLRLTIHGKGLTRPAIRFFELEHAGANQPLEMRDTDRHI